MSGDPLSPYWREKVEAVFAGRVYPPVGPRMRRPRAPSERQKFVVLQLALGFDSAAIARSLGVSASNVRKLKQRALRPRP